LNRDILRQSIIESTKFIFTTTDYIHERTWTAEVFYRISKILPDNFLINSEVPIGTNGRIDIGIRDLNNKLICGIELKGTYEANYPLELLNNMEMDKELYRSFYSKTQEIIQDKTKHNVRSLYPRDSNEKYFMNMAIYEKLIQLHDQYNRMVKLGILGFVVFVDHNDDYTIRTETHGYSEDVFNNNFKFRKRIIEDNIHYNKNNNVEYLHFVKYNSVNGPHIELLT
jgi:hypothetical protein